MGNKGPLVKGSIYHWSFHWRMLVLFQVDPWHGWKNKNKNPGPMIMTMRSGIARNMYILPIYALYMKRRHKQTTDTSPTAHSFLSGNPVSDGTVSLCLPWPPGTGCAVSSWAKVFFFSLAQLVSPTLTLPPFSTFRAPQRKY